MRSIAGQIFYFMRRGSSRRNVKLLVNFLIVLAVMVAGYSVIFQLLMEWEGQEHSWLSGFYWTFVTMSTTGFGDITFHTDLGRVFTLIVLVSGTIFMLILLPVMIIQFFFAPWMEAQSQSLAPREIPATTTGHVILTHFDPVVAALINKLDQYHYPYVLLTPETDEALRLHDQGLKVVVGGLDNPETYRRVRVEHAALVATTATDPINTNVVFTVREMSEKVPIISTVNYKASVDILELAGCNKVLQLAETMGQSLARRAHAGDSVTHLIGEIDQLLIAEATATGTPLVGKTLAECNLRETVGVTVVGVWERGRFETAGPDTRVTSNTVLVLAGSRAQLNRYDDQYRVYGHPGAPVVIIGGGRVGRATGRTLAEWRIDYRIVERMAERIRDPAKYVLGDAAELEVLQKAGIMETSTVVLTTHDDDINIYLTIYCRRLRPDIQIISRATHERNVQTLHRAGADFVMSYASMGANTIFNLLQRSDILLVAEGLSIFKMKTPAALAGKTIRESAVRRKTGCNMIAVHDAEALQINPDPDMTLPADAELIMIGSVEAEDEFLRLYGDH